MFNKTPRATASGRSDAGVSLVEVVMVTLVVAIVTAFTLPAVSGAIRAYNLRSAADHLAERLSAVRALAMAKNRNVTFSFNNNTGRYGFDFNGDGAPDTSDPDDPLQGGYYWGTLPDGVTTTFPGGNPIAITFNSRGELPIGAVAQNLVLQSSGRSATVSVNLRGRISVQ
ncbi:MAG: GspH/FimT family protein [Acidobacteriota bacterium]